MSQAVVLAAGYSSRAKTNKMALKIDDIAILQRIVMTLQQSCREVIVVSGHYHEDIVALVGNMYRVIVVKNNDYDQGMFSSIKTGLMFVDEDCFITPGDCPLIHPSTINKMLETDGCMVVPVYKGRKGHPLLVRQLLIEALKKEPITSNMKAFRNRYPLTCLEVDDKGILVDIDTQEDYREVLQNIERGKKIEDTIL